MSRAERHVLPGAAGLVVGQRVTVDVAGRETGGTIMDIAWTPSFNAQQSVDVTVDIGETAVVTGPGDIEPR